MERMGMDEKLSKFKVYTPSKLGRPLCDVYGTCRRESILLIIVLILGPFTLWFSATCKSPRHTVPRFRISFQGSFAHFRLNFLFRAVSDEILVAWTLRLRYDQTFSITFRS